MMINENIRLSFFAFALIGFFSVAMFFPFRARSIQHNLLRWQSNLFLALLNAILAKIILPSGLVYLGSQYSDVGLFRFFSTPVLKFVLSIALLDLLIYWQHRAFHFVPFFWRFHRVHHSDTEFDTTTGLRFHPVEIVFSLLIKASAIVIFGIPASAVLAFEVLLNFSSLLNHSNFSLPYVVEKFFRIALVTPDWHRVHHSVAEEETNSNFGFCLSLWDRLFKSYRSQTRQDPQRMLVGLHEYRTRDEQKLFNLLAQPWRQFKQ